MALTFKRANKPLTLVGRLAYRAGWPLLWLLSHDSCRVRVVLLKRTKRGLKVLLVRGWLSDGSWELPGGGIKGKETTKVAAVREVKEELGLRLNLKGARQLRSIHTESGLRFCIHPLIAVVTPKARLKLSKLEIAEARWFSVKSLPDNISSSSAKILAQKKVINQSAAQLGG